jgi:AraC family transcriptional regulator
MLVFHPAEERHSQKIGDKPVVSFNVEADAAWDGMGMAAPVFDSSACCQGDLPALLALRMYREFQAFDDLSAVTMEGLALQLLASAARQSDAAWGRQPGWMPRVEEFLRAHYTRAFSLSEVAAAAGVHPVYLSGAFRKSKGCTVGDYVRRLRVDLARAALAGRDRTLQAIAADCGFSDQSHFTRVFHRLTGLTPAEYRRRMDGGRLAG